MAEIRSIITSIGTSNYKMNEQDLYNAENKGLMKKENHNKEILQPLIWRNIIGLTILHFLALYMFVKYCREAKFWTIIFGALYGHCGGYGITAGAHRLWSHKSYSAKLPLKIFLACLYLSAGHPNLYSWVRDHRTHHRYSDTSSDPHNSTRGFFFSHIGWLMMAKHPDVKENGKKIDMTDIINDPVVQFVDRHYIIYMVTMCFVLPTVIPVYCWGELWHISFGAVIFRYTVQLHAAFLVNSAAHIWGSRPYNKSLKPADNRFVSFWAGGEGWHNYHHSFPWDYKAAELGNYNLNPTTGLIDMMAWLGQAYDLKSPSKEHVENLISIRGDGSKVY